MNDPLKNKTQQEITLKYSNELKQLIGSAYSNFLANHSVDDFKIATEMYTDNENGILSRIKKNYLLDNEQKDDLFRKYYIILMDGLDGILNVNERNDVRQAIFKHLTEKNMFCDKHIVGDLVKDKFKKEFDEIKQKIEKQIQQDVLQTQPKTVQYPSPLPELKQNVNQADIQRNTIPQEHNVNQNNNDCRMNEQFNTHISQENTGSQQDNPSEVVFTADDFYRYKNISDIIDGNTKTLINNEYDFILSEIKNSKIENKLSIKNSDQVFKDFNNRKGVNLLMDVPTQQRKLNKNHVQQALYDKDDKDMKNSIGICDGVTVDAMRLNSNISAKR